MPAHPAAIILAAGDSSRMGAPKQLLELEGRSLLRRAVETAAAARCAPVIVVTGRESSRLAAELNQLPATIAFNANWEKGIGASIRVGANAALSASPKIGAMLLMLCDQPLITPHMLRALIEAREASGKPACVSEYAGTLGPPVLIGRSLFPQLLSLPDDRGAKEMWADRPELVCRVACPAAQFDIDTTEDYQRLLHARKSIAPGITLPR